MAQKQYGVIPQDTTQVGYGQDEPVAVHAEDRKESFAQKMVSMLTKHRKKKEKEKAKTKQTYKKAGEDIKSNIEKRKEAQKESLK